MSRSVSWGVVSASPGPSSLPFCRDARLRRGTGHVWCPRTAMDQAMPWSAARSWRPRRRGAFHVLLSFHARSVDGSSCLRPAGSPASVRWIVALSSASTCLAPRWSAAAVGCCRTGAPGRLSALYFARHPRRHVGVGVYRVRPTETRRPLDDAEHRARRVWGEDTRTRESRAKRRTPAARLRMAARCSEALL